MLRSLLFSLLLSVGCGLWAQAPASITDSLPSSEVQAQFLEELSELMTDGKPKPVEEAFREFEQVYQSGYFTPEEKAEISQIGLMMRSRRLGASPYFDNYLGGLVKIKNDAAGEARFREWHDVYRSFLLDEVADHSPNEIAAFLKFSRNFFEFNTLQYSPKSTSWFVFGDDFQWSYDDQPLLKIEQADLVAIRQDDSLAIRQTAGVYFPLEKQFQGTGGETSWDRTDLGEEVYVDLEEYTLETVRSLYEAPVAYLHFPQYFGGSRIKGSFSDKLVSDNSRTSYPRFDSESDYLDISNVGQGVRLKGGFRLYGETVYAFGTSERPAEVLILNDRNQPRFLGRSERLTVRVEDRIVGENVHAVLYLGADSLFHPSVNLRYRIPEQEVQLTRGDRGSNRNPFYHSLHQMTIEADYMNAYLRTDSLIIGKPTASFANREKAVFESIGYFDQGQYDRIQSIGTANPLEIMKATAEREGTNFMDAALVANRINSRFTVDNIQPLLYDLVSKGFINYDSDRQEIELKDKVYHYVDADMEQTDYDFMRLVSDVDSANAVIDLESGYSVISGVKNLELSRPQRVALVPVGGQLFVKGNRNVDFDGRVFAGFGLFEGKDFHYEYEPHQVVMDSIRFFDLFVPTGEVDENLRPKAFSIGSRIEHLNGVLLVDAPTNKAGREDIFIFPSFQSKDYSYVFYDRDSTLNGIYTRDSFYFRLDAFSFDHLDKFGPQDLSWEGTMFSSGIFPEFSETLLLQDEDQSLGFTRPTPDGGFASYGGKGNYDGDISLSNQGFLGVGELQYLGASINSEDFTFMPEETTASAERFDLEEDREGPYPVPQVRGEDVRINWRPYRDSMLVRSAEAPFQLYQADEHQLEGLLVLTPDGLKGDGKLSWSAADVSSKIFSFGPFSATADTMNVNIKALQADDRLALQTSNVFGDIDFDEQEGFFKANDEYVITTLPYNQYITSINEFTWDMDGSVINFESLEGQPGVFTSIHPDQDSLQFEGKNAIFDLSNSLLQVEGVYHIVSADAFIYPDSQYVVIAPNAEMQRLENARIIADTTNEYHVINRATVDIRGRRFYEASGFYEYNVGPHEQEIELQNIVGQPVGKGAYSEKRTVTRATGEIDPTDTFYIDHKTIFRGTISLNAESATLKFDGFARLQAENLPQRPWFTVSFEGDKNDLIINYDIPNAYEGDPLYAGIFLSKEFGTVYPRALGPLLFRKDRQLLPVTKGVFFYDEDRDEFIFGDSSVVIREELRGNRMVFKNRDGSVEGEGRLNLGSELKYVELHAAGRINTVFPPPPPEPEPVEEEPTSNIMLADDPVEEEPEEEPEPEPELPPTTADAMMGVIMQVPEPLLRIVANDFKSATFDSRLITYLTDLGFYRRTVNELFPEGEDLNAAMEGLSLGFLDMPQRSNPYTFLFSRVPLKWNEEYQSFLSTDKNIGLVSVGSESLNKMVESYIEVRMPSVDGDDRLYIYLKSPSGLYYFFGYKQGILSITSNNTVYMQELENMKARDLVIKMPDGETFEIQPVEVSTATTFLRRVQAGQ